MQRDDSQKLDYMVELLEGTHARIEKLEGRVEKTETQLFLYKTAIQVLKWVFGVLGAILTLKFGDVGKYFHG